MNRVRLSRAVASLALISACRQAPAVVPSSSTNVDVVARPWADEFDGPAGARPDPTIWTYDLGNNNGWGNGELQIYTSDAANVHLDGQGHLVIRAQSMPAGFSSARVKTQGLKAVQYGHLEARIKMPTGAGVWPAFWMLGTSFTGANWPAAGEIDVAEMKGSEPQVAYGTVHGPGYSGGGGLSRTTQLPGGGSLADGFHVFAIDWQPGRVAFLLDGEPYHTVVPTSLPAGGAWVFDQPFFVLLNVAIGGAFTAPPDTSTAFPADMLLDYVRYTP